jgi:hypothetical protein
MVHNVTNKTEVKVTNSLRPKNIFIGTEINNIKKDNTLMALKAL